MFSWDPSGSADCEWPRHGFFSGGKAHSRMQRGDITPIILSILKEKPMHGYEIIRTLEKRSHGFWRPSAGSVYPTLQLLEDQELVEGRSEAGKKVYSVTEKGKQAPEEDAAKPWESHHRTGKNFKHIAEAVREVMQAARAVVFSADPQRIEGATAILKQAAERLEALSVTNEKSKS
jgi:DNA-binding PadR family transcriptional regulator